MKRRDVLAGAVVGAGVAACSRPEGEPVVAQAPAAKPIEWKMVTTWPANFPGLGVGASRLAERIGQLSGGRLTVKVYGAGELVPALEVFDAVSTGTAEMGHGGAYYWKGKSEAAQAVRLDSLGWARYGFGSDHAVHAKMREIAALSPRSRRL